MKLQNTPLENSFNFLKRIISNGGPEKREFADLDHAFNTISNEFKCGRIGHSELDLLEKGFGDEFLEHTIHGHVKVKPFGYAGDFMIIDKIYQEQVTEDIRFKKWDIFWHNHAALKAVRNRKDYFIAMMLNKIIPQKNMRLLDVASGPARDVLELYQKIQPGSLHTVCVDADAYAINYAKNITRTFSEQIEFVHKNIFRFNTTEQFDVVWSAGLFDYFNDETFVRLIQKFRNWVNPGGEIIIGNFGLENPSRNYMEIIGEWFLEHRSEEKLVNLALEAGFGKEDIFVGREQEGVNLFLHLRIKK